MGSSLKGVKEAENSLEKQGLSGGRETGGGGKEAVGETTNYCCFYNKAFFSDEI